MSRQAESRFTWKQKNELLERLSEKLRRDGLGAFARVEPEPQDPKRPKAIPRPREAEEEREPLPPPFHVTSAPGIVLNREHRLIKGPEPEPEPDPEPEDIVSGLVQAEASDQRHLLGIVEQRCVRRIREAIEREDGRRRDEPLYGVSETRWRFVQKKEKPPGEV